MPDALTVADTGLPARIVPEDAPTDFERGLRAHPDREMLGRLHYNLALAHRARGDRSSALDQAEMSVRVGSQEARPLRDELRRYGIYAIGGGWVVQLPVWLQVLVYANPVSYQLDLLRLVLLDFRQLPLALDLGVVLLLPPLAAALAAQAMRSMMQRP